MDTPETNNNKKDEAPKVKDEVAAPKNEQKSGISPTQQHLLKAAYTDELTGLFNRRYLKENIRAYISRLGERNLPLTMMMLDIDHFKDVNDTHGHLAGDNLLSGFATLLKKLCANRAVAVRYAGDEFMIILPKYDKKAGSVLAAKLIEVLNKGSLKVDEGKSLKITTSIGIASFPKDAMDYDELFKRSDQALYVAKESGRAQYFIYPDDKRMISPDLVSSIFPLSQPVGRDDTVAYLTDYILSELREIPVITGEMGMGKTYLLRWAEKRALREKLQVFNISGHSFWKMQPLAALYSAISHYRQKHIDRFKEIVSQMNSKHKDVILDRLDIKRTEKELSPDSLVSAPTEFLLKVLDYGKTIITIDDLQMVDGDTIRFLNSFFHQFSDKPAYPIFTYQLDRSNPTGMIPVMGMLPLLQSRIKGITLDNFVQKDVDMYLHKLLEKVPLTPEQIRIFSDNCDGKPLFVQEILKYLISSGKLSFEVDHWVTKDILNTDLSTSMQRISKERLKKLSPKIIKVLAQASHIGDSFDVEMLASITDLPTHELFLMMRKADAQHIIIEAVGQEGDFTFVNPIDKNVLADMLPKEAQEALHRRIVEIEEKLSGGDTSRVLGRLMYHLNQGSMWRQASQLFRNSETSFIDGKVSDQALARLQQKTLTKTMAKQEPLPDEDLIKAVKTVRNFKIAIQNLKLYPKTNENVRKSIERVYDDLTFFFTKTEGLSFSGSAGTVIINGAEPPLKDLSSIASDFYALLTSHGLQGILFVKDLIFDELLAFMEILSTKFEGNVDWDNLLEENNIERILPDRKVYVAMGEHKIVLGGQEKVVVGQAASKGSGNPEVGKEMYSEYQELMNEFRDDAKELIKSLHDGNLDSEKLLELTYLLREINTKQLPAVETAQQKVKVVPKEVEKELDPDHETLNDSSKDIENTFLDLCSNNKKKSALAAARLAAEKEKLPKLVFEFISTENSPQSNRLIAYVLKNSGDANVRAFLGYVKPSLPRSKLNAILKVLDIFGDTDILYRKLRDVIIQANNQQLVYIEKLLLKAPENRAQKAIVALLEVAPMDVKIRILKTAGIMKISGVSKFVKETLQRPNFWEKWENVVLTTEAARASGALQDADEELVELLQDLVVETRLFKLNVPSSIRVAALWALSQIEPGEMDTRLNKLLKDKNPRIQAQAKQMLKL